MIQSPEDLIVWKKAMELVTQVYLATRSFPKEELFGLTNQVRRAAVSIPSNIAEGQGRMTTGEFRQFLGVARGSLMEVKTQVLIAGNLQYLDQSQLKLLTAMTDEIGRLLNGLINSLKN